MHLCLHSPPHQHLASRLWSGVGHLWSSSTTSSSRLVAVAMQMRFLSFPCRPLASSLAPPHTRQQPRLWCARLQCRSLPSFSTLAMAEGSKGVLPDGSSDSEPSLTSIQQAKTVRSMCAHCL